MSGDFEINLTHAASTSTEMKNISDSSWNTLSKVLNEGLDFTIDRSRHATEHYLLAHGMLVDDPEYQHYLRMQSNPEFSKIRYFLSSLPWYQKQLIAETRDVEKCNISELDTNLFSGELEDIHKDVYDSDSEFVSIEEELPKYFVPPSFSEADRCATCGQIFNVKLFRHHCRHCGRSFCGQHASVYRRIHKFRYCTTAVRVCLPCCNILDIEERRDRSLWRVLRLKAFYTGDLIPYFDLRVDRQVDKVYRFV
jgi:hypothetical protein